MNSSWNSLLSLPRTHVSFVQRVIGFKIKLRPFVMPILPIKKQLSQCQGSIFHSWIPPLQNVIRIPCYRFNYLCRELKYIKSPSNWLPLHAVMLRKINLHQSRKGGTKYVYHCYCKCCICRHLYDRRLVGVWEAKCCLVIQLWPPKLLWKKSKLQQFCDIQNVRQTTLFARTLRSS